MVGGVSGRSCNQWRQCTVTDCCYQCPSHSIEVAHTHTRLLPSWGWLALRQRTERTVSTEQIDESDARQAVSTLSSCIETCDITQQLLHDVEQASLAFLTSQVRERSSQHAGQQQESCACCRALAAQHHSLSSCGANRSLVTSQAPTLFSSCVSLVRSQQCKPRRLIAQRDE